MKPYARDSSLAGSIAGSLPIDQDAESYAGVHVGRGRPHPLLRLTLGSLLSVLAYLAGTWFDTRLAFPFLELQTVSAFLVGLLLGPWGIAGIGAGYLALATGSGSLAYYLAQLGTYLPAAVVTSLMRPWIETHSRDLCRYFRVLVATIVATVGVVLAGAGLLSPSGFSSAIPLQVAMNLGTLVLFTPLAVLGLPTPSHGFSSMPPRARSRRFWALSLALSALAGLGLLAVASSERLASMPLARHQLLTILFLVPCTVAALAGTVRFALLTASVAGIGYLLIEGFLGNSSSARILLVYIHPILFAAAAAAVTWRQQKLLSLGSRLRESYRQLTRHEERIADALDAALAARDLQTSEHLRRVSSYTVAVAQRLGLAEPDLRIIRLGARLHDIGKLAIPDHVLSKPGPLTAEERLLVRLHPEIGANILAGLDALGDVVPLVYQHQERWDGAGYPQGLAGEDICLGARIIAVVDAFDAMVSDRPYRPALTLWAAIRELRSEAGHQFDPQVVEAFLATQAEHPWPGRSA